MAVSITPPGGVASAGGTVEFAVAETDGATYAWARDGQTISGATAAKLVLSPVQTEDAGAYTATVTKDGTSETSAPAYLAVRGEAPLEWDGTFVQWVVVAAIALIMGLGWPLFWAVATIVHQHGFPANYPKLLAVEFVLVGLVLAAASIFVALVELRGRSRKPKPAPAQPPPGGATAMVEGETPPTAAGWVSAVAGAAPDTIKAWGNLKVTAALLLAALGLFAGGATLAWRSLGGKPAPGTTTVTTTVQQTSTG